ncbi:MAG: HD domain-containing phosphohydrolase [Desulfovibrio sp.]|uniref:response regulator n=1 Tax=Desulfovibrio sp. 7SRBS1 TaxID=3378064 RepID=UPI003B3E797D
MSTSNLPRILLVDDNRPNLKILIGALRDEYKISVATNGRQALDMVEALQPDIILLDVMMPEMNGYQVCEKLKENPNTADIPVIFITALTDSSEKARAFQAGGVDFITKPVELIEVKARVSTHLALERAQLSLKNQNATLEQRVQERTRELSDTRIDLIRRLSMAAEYRDTDTGDHILRMSHYCKLIADNMGLSHDLCEEIYVASPMHDVGKIGIPDHILRKPGKLDPSEWEIMKTHTTIGAEILSNGKYSLLQTARTIALTHHERWDGKGYPNGLAGKDIPISGRIVGLCDVFDALTSVRPYKAAWPVDKAVETICEENGTHFDPVVVECFMDLQPEVNRIREAHETDMAAASPSE